MGTGAADNQKKPVDGETKAEISKDRLEERVKPEAVIIEGSGDTETMKPKGKSVDDCSEKQAEKGQNWRKIEEGIPLKHVPYPHAPPEERLRGSSFDSQKF